jgi:DNA polymerase-4
MYSSYDLFLKAQLVLNRQPVWKKVSNLAVSCYELVKDNSDQLELFGSGEQKRKQLSKALDKINDRYGEYVITPALMMGMNETILDRISFGGVKDLEDLYTQNTI